MRIMIEVFTRKDYDRLPEGFPAELIDGCLVKEAAPTYGHQRIAARLRAALVACVGPDRVPDAPNDVAIDDHNVFQPDVVVLDAPVEDASSYVGVPRLVVEVLSRSTRRRDRAWKAGRYLGIGVAEVWLVDPETGKVECRREDGTASVQGEEELRSRAVEGFAVVPAQLFTPAR